MVASNNFFMAPGAKGLKKTKQGYFYFAIFLVDTVMKDTLSFFIKHEF